jgi:MOSC domain-containing protein YiiM
MPDDHGTPGAEDPMDRPWRSGIAKQPVNDPVYLGQINLDGDGQADRKHHGGPDKAVCVYPRCRLDYWANRLDRDVEPGAFGENVTAEGQDETSACIGDVYRVGEAVVQVSQPRSPCWKLARYWNEKKLALWVQETGYTGWYFRVLETGYVQAGQSLVLEKRPCPEWTVMRANEVRYHRPEDLDAAAELANCSALGSSWRDTLRQRLEKRETQDDAKRLRGPNEPE